MVQQFMTLDHLLKKYRDNYDIVSELNLDHWHNLQSYEREAWLRDSLAQVRKDAFNDNERLLCILSKGDVYTSDQAVGDIVKNLQALLNQVDITNFFVVLLTNEPVEPILNWFQVHSHDQTTITVDTFSSPSKPETKITSKKTGYQYNSSEPINISINELSQREKFLLLESKVFCIYPWIHLHAYPTGEVYPCCHAEMGVGKVGNCRSNSLNEIWHDQPMNELRSNMLNEISSKACARCYEQEESGFFSGRKSANKHHGHNIKHLDDQDFRMTYWDIRFSNLCNLSCRSCGHLFSSGWYQDQVKLAGPEWAKNNKVLNYAGRTETDMWEQLVPHLDYVEQIYFARGEPLMMEEHYKILEELERRERFDVRLIYNTNFTHVKLKDRYVFDYWKKFKSVAVGASLDAMGPRGEYIRKGTNWDTVERNRERMLQDCPDVDFYISPTLSIMNALHVPDFHRNWVNRGFLRPQDLNVNILQNPEFFRIDIAPAEFKQRIKDKFEEHLVWLRPQDKLQRATVGFESAINFMMATDNTHLIENFWKRTEKLDTIRKENILEVIPELEALK